MDYQVILSPAARRDLRDIVRYISADSPEKALSFGQFLVSKTKVLAQFPLMGRAVPEFSDEAIREIVVRSYRVVCRLNHSSHLVEITRFWHAARGVPRL